MIVCKISSKRPFCFANFFSKTAFSAKMEYVTTQPMENARKRKQKEYFEIYPQGCKLPCKMGVFGENTKNSPNRPFCGAIYNFLSTQNLFYSYVCYILQDLSKSPLLIPFSYLFIFLITPKAPNILLPNYILYEWVSNIAMKVYFAGFTHTFMVWRGLQIP